MTVNVNLSNIVGDYLPLSGGSLTGQLTVIDDILVKLGSDGDIVLVLRSTSLAANTALTDVLVGTVVGPALAANSFVGSNITASGDYALYGNRGGNSECFLWYDSSSGQMNFYANGGAQFRLYVSATVYVSIAAEGDLFSGNERDVGGASAPWRSLYLSTSITRASLAGIAGGIAYDIPIGAGGAANAVVKHNFQLDSVDEAGLFGETDGSGSYNQLKAVWKVPYSDAGAGAVGPTAPTTATTWNGGLSLRCSDAVANGRLYWMANETQHYVDATAGFNFLHKEPTTFGDFNNWQPGSLLALKVDRYNENGGHALPYPFERAIRETEWASTVEERLAAVEEANRILKSQLVAAGIAPEV